MQVNVIRNKGGMSLVEWVSGSDKMPTRSWVKMENVKDGEVDHPERGVPYGIDFTHNLTVKPITASDITRELRRVGIWSIDDLRQNQAAVQGALSAAYGLTLSSILQAAERYEDSLNKATKVEEGDKEEVTILPMPRPRPVEGS